MVIQVGLEIALVLHVLVALVVSGHAVLSKRDTRAAAGWVGVIWLAPLVGVMLYIWLGINRIERRAARPRGFPSVLRESSIRRSHRTECTLNI
jgi:cardiolipin synthase